MAEEYAQTAFTNNYEFAQGSGYRLPEYEFTVLKMLDWRGSAVARAGLDSVRRDGVELPDLTAWPEEAEPAITE